MNLHDKGKSIGGLVAPEEHSSPKQALERRTRRENDRRKSYQGMIVGE